MDETEKLSDEIAEKKKNNKKKLFTYLAFILINALVILILLLIEDKSGDAMAGKEAFARMGQNWHFTVIMLLLYPAILMSDILVFFVLTKRMNIKKNFGLSLRVSIYGRYYDRLTPWAMGGEPFQIGYLALGGVKPGDGGAITMSRHIIRFFSVAVVVIIILLASRITTNAWVMAAAITSVFVGLIFPSFMLLCCFKPKIGLKIGEGVIKLLYKMKLIKDYNKYLEKMNTEINSFIKGLEYLSANKKIIVIIAAASIFELFATNSVPFFVMKALGVGDITYWHTLVLCIFVTYASSFAPTPGGAGIAELSFYAIFAAHIGGNYLFWAVLFWRIIIFYLPVFIGFVLQTVEATVALIRSRKT